MDLEDVNLYTLAHRSSVQAHTYSTEKDFTQSIELHQRAIQLFSQLITETNEKELSVITTYRDLIASHEESLLYIQRTLSINSLPSLPRPIVTRRGSVVPAALATYSPGIKGQRGRTISAPQAVQQSGSPTVPNVTSGSGTSNPAPTNESNLLLSTPPKPAPVNSYHQHPHLIQISTHTAVARTTQSETSPIQQTGQQHTTNITNVTNVLQLVQIFLHSDLLSAAMSRSGSDGNGSYARVQTLLSDLISLTRRVHSTLQSSLGTPPVALSQQEEQRIQDELRRRMDHVEQIASLLQNARTSGQGLTQAQVQSLEKQFAVLKQTYSLTLLNDLTRTTQNMHCLASTQALGMELERKLAELTSTLENAAKQAQLNAASGTSPQFSIAPPTVSPSLDPSSLPSPAGSAASDAQLKSLLAEKAALQKQLHDRDRELKLERANRIKVEKSLAKHEERWRQLNEKVALKKAQALQQLDGGSSGSTNPTDLSSTSPLAKPPSLSSQQRSSSTGSSGATAQSSSASPNTGSLLFSAKPVRVSVNPTQQQPQQAPR